MNHSYGGVFPPPPSNRRRSISTRRTSRPPHSPSYTVALQFRAQRGPGRVGGLPPIRTSSDITEKVKVGIGADQRGEGRVRRGVARRLALCWASSALYSNAENQLHSRDVLFCWSHWPTVRLPCLAFASLAHSLCWLSHARFAAVLKSFWEMH